MRKCEDILIPSVEQKQEVKIAYTGIRDYVFDVLLLNVIIYMKL